MGLSGSARLSGSGQHSPRTGAKASTSSHRPELSGGNTKASSSSGEPLSGGEVKALGTPVASSEGQQPTDSSVTGGTHAPGGGAGRGSTSGSGGHRGSSAGRGSGSGSGSGPQSSSSKGKLQEGAGSPGSPQSGSLGLQIKAMANASAQKRNESGLARQVGWSAAAKFLVLFPSV